MQVAKASQLRLLLRTQDSVLSGMIFGLSVNIYAYFDQFQGAEIIPHIKLVGIVIFMGVLASLLFEPRLHRQNYRDFLLFSVSYSLVSFFAFMVLNYLGTLQWVDTRLILFYVLFLTITLFLNRLFLHWWYLHGRRQHRANNLKVVVVGTGPRSAKLMKAYQEHVEWEVDIVAQVEPGTNSVGGLFGDETIALVRGTARFSELLSSKVVDEVVVCVPRSMLDDVEPLVKACAEQGISLKFMADFYELQSLQMSLESVGGIPILNLQTVPLNSSAQALKRLIDIVVASVVLGVFWPLLLLIAIVVKLETDGPALFAQRRVGLNKRTFSMYKFRSMRQDAEQQLSRVEHLNEATGPIFKMKNDPRVTRVGKFLRHYSLDELPQFVNVLLGHMSIVGPRPMSLRDVGLFDRAVQHKRVSVRPGLACLREVSGRSRLSFDRWLELDLEYIDSWSVMLDLKIMVRLVPAVIRGDGAV